MKYLYATILLLSTAPFGWGAVDLKLPDKVTGEPGEFIRVPATTSGKVVKWVVLDKGLNLFPVDLLKDSKTAVVTAKEKGTYRLMAYTALADDASDPAITKVVVGGEDVKPPPPPDVSALGKVLKAAYDTAPDVAALKALTDLYATWATAVLDEKKTKVDTWLDLMNALRASVAITSIGDKIKPVREALAKHAATKVPSDQNTAMTAEERKKASALFTEIATALKEVSK